MRINYLFPRVFFLLIFIWILLSVGRTIYNISKLFTEDIPVTIQTEDQKQKDIFGLSYDIFKIISENTPHNAKIIFLVPKVTIDQGLFYQAQYFLYPRSITVLEMHENTKNMNFESFKAVFIVDKTLPKLNSEKFKVFKFVEKPYYATLLIHE